MAVPSIVVCGGSGFNILERAHAVTPLIAFQDPNFPAGNAADGMTWKPFRWNGPAAPGSYVYLQADTQLLSNGEYEVAFSKGLPADPLPGIGTWGKTAGATLVRSTTNQRTGVACLKVQGGASNYGQYDYAAVAGETITIDLWGRAGPVGGTALVRIQNLKTGKWLNALGGWSSAQQDFLNTTSATYVNKAATAVVESLVACQTDRPTIRVYFYGSAVDDPLYDDCILFPHASFASVHGHNVPPRVTAEVLTGPTTPPSTVVATFTVRPGSFYATFSPQGSRYWWFKFTGDTEEGLWLGEAVLGQSTTLSRMYNPGEDTTFTFQQESGNGMVPPVLLSDLPRRTVAVSFRYLSDAQHNEAKEFFVKKCRGAHPMVIVLDSTDPESAIYGRMQEKWKVTRDIKAIRDADFVIEEMVMPKAPYPSPQQQGQ